MKTKELGEVAQVYYEDSDEDGLICKGAFIESEYKGTLLKVEISKHENN